MIYSDKQTLTWWEMRALQAINIEDIDFPDIVALDKDEQIILIAEVKGLPFNFQEIKAKKYAILRLIDYLKAANIVIPFAMLADVNEILIFQWDGNNLSEPILSLNTADVLSHYEPKFRDTSIFSLYLKGLIEAWISDFCYHWKSEIPPASKEIVEIGLSQLLKGGITQP
ncbi:MAG: hypothetical protein V7L14_28010 [Nostoc sp.]|uniref:hypothetical protein n=1 Tax=Nostoc sp. TaxID=1180 RepID=UPI002FF78668